MSINLLLKQDASPRSSLMSIFASLALLAAALAAPAAWAGGGDEDAGDAAVEGPSYYGFVRDNRGATVAGATVMLRGKVGKPAEQKTNMLGMYRTHINKDVKPADVVMTCVKPGYREAKGVRRNVPDQTPSRIQIDCVMQKA